MNEQGRRLIAFGFCLAAVVAPAATAVKGQTVLVKPYVQPGDGPGLDGEDAKYVKDVKVIRWLTDQAPGDFRVEYGSADSADDKDNKDDKAVKSVTPERVALDFKAAAADLKPAPPPDLENLPEDERKIPPAKEQHYFRYSATLADLPLDARVRYRVKLGDTVVRESVFRTRASRDKSVRFVAVGDLADGKMSQNPVAYQISLARPDFVLLLGDIVYPQGRVNQYMDHFWGTYCNAAAAGPAAGAPLMASVPFYPVLGNHDVAAKFGDYPDALGAYYFFSVPANGPGEGPWSTPIKGDQAPFRAAAGSAYPSVGFYSFDYGPAHFLVLDSGAYVPVKAPDLVQWIERDLGGTRAPWKFVCFHAPAFHTSTQHFTEQKMRLLEPTFEKCGVDVVFAGHVHNYQRSKPLRFSPANPSRLELKGSVTGTFTIDEKFDGAANPHPDGVIHVVCGGGGARLYTVNQKTMDTVKKANPKTWAPFTAKSESLVHSITVVDLSPEKFQLRALSEQGKEIDRFTIEKPARRAEGAPGAPGPEGRVGAAGPAGPTAGPEPHVAPEQHVGDTRDGGTVVATGQLVRPAGSVVEFSGRPVDLAAGPPGTAAAGNVYVKDNRGIVVLDAEQWTVRQELKFPAGGGSMHGIAVARDGNRLYASGSASVLWEGLIGPDGLVKWGRAIVLPGQVRAEKEAEGAAPETKPAAKLRPSYPCGVALSADGKTACVCLSINNSLAVVDLEAGKVVSEAPVGVAPFDVVLSPDGQTAYVSNWGGRRPQPGERTANSAGTATLVDQRGIASSGTVGVIDLRPWQQSAGPVAQVAQIDVGLHPAGLALGRDGKALYVANANSDTVSVVDTAARKVRETVPVRPDASLPFGSASNALCLSPDGKRLFVADGGNNAVAVVEVAEGQPSRVAGFIPSGWYPGAVACQGDRLFIANVKGVGSRDAKRVKTGWSSYYYRGTVGRVDFPDAEALRRYTEQVRADARVPEALAAMEREEKARAAAASGGPESAAVPLPAHPGEPSAIEHVVYVIKENRTYDQVFGDLKQGNGDPALCIFGRDVTPNHHALAEQFVLLDNYYCNGVLSADGHQWAVEGAVADGLEKSFGGWTRSYPFGGDDPLSSVSSGFLWDDVLLHGLSFRNFGEMVLTDPVPASASFTQIYQDRQSHAGKIGYKQKIATEELSRYTCPDYPGWNLRIPDAVRADVFLKELAGFEREGRMPNLVIVYLPNDHTSGTSPSAPTPAAMVADNDLALGRVVEGLSHSRFWKSACVFVNEDDPQNGFDHVDGHRSLCLVVSPYSRRRATVSAFYNQTSVLHTIEEMLGLPPMTQFDAAAPVMRECFTDHADLAPFTALPNPVPLDQMNPKPGALRGEARHWAEQSLAQRLDEPDRVDEETFNRVLWFAQKGEGVPYPAAFAGAHGKGLAKLGLKAEPGAGKRGKDGDDDD